jgi:predicted membrane protein
MQTNHMQIIVESYETEDAARTRTTSSAKSIVDVPLPDWSPIYADNLLNFVTSDLAWSNAQILP